MLYLRVAPRHLLQGTAEVFALLPAQAFSVVPVAA
jgi:hypothetical protein